MFEDSTHAYLADLDRASLVDDSAKVFLKKCESPPHRPKSEGFCFTDVYLGDNFQDATRPRSANFYASFPYPFNLADADEARNGSTLSEYREKLAIFTESFYFENEGFFTLKMASIVLALRRVETGEIIFELGKGGDGRGWGKFRSSRRLELTIAQR